MGHSAAVWDQRAAIEVTKDWNEIDQVMLRSPRGASARFPSVRCKKNFRLTELIGVILNHITSAAGTEFFDLFATANWVATEE
ncbi:hypothetical protein C5167_028411 [Papaver somniferum]|nr:hypothetical protein C5167_028411 [Papaver somniferum]